jgi:hypothetical protein
VAVDVDRGDHGRGAAEELLDRRAEPLRGELHPPELVDQHDGALGRLLQGGERDPLEGGHVDPVPPHPHRPRDPHVGQDRPPAPEVLHEEPGPGGAPADLAGAEPGHRDARRAEALREPDDHRGLPHPGPAPEQDPGGAHAGATSSSQRARARNQASTSRRP